MSRPRRIPPAGALFAALLAVTLNLLQPLAHAALMRDGGPGVLWSAWCKAAAADPDGPAAPDRDAPLPPAAAGQHDCCLGLAHAPSLVAPSNDFVLLPPIESVAAPALPADLHPAVAIRDGPTQPRGPPPPV
jgi:hypothetical protein